MLDAILVMICQDTTLAVRVAEVVASIQGMTLELVADHDEACRRLAGTPVALILSHLTPAGDVAGLTRLLRTVQATSSRTPVLVLSDEYHAEQALALLRLGVAEYLSRPLDLGRLGYLIDVLTLGARRRAAPPVPEPQPTDVPAPIADEESFLLASGGRMKILFDQIRRIAPRDTTILLGGETGTGKTRLAGLIHRLSPRRDRPFLAINCGALSASLIESEMFGHAKGAFTGADAPRVGKFAEVGRGTLFLDEIDSLPHPLQAKLLRAVEDRMFEPVGSNKTQTLHARLIVASNRPLDQEVACGRFRSDLYYRLNVIAFTLPPLRERSDAIPALARHFLREFGGHADRSDLRFDAEVLRILEGHDWPGNIRELKNVIERSVALSDGPIIRVADLPESLQQVPSTPAMRPQLAPASTLARSRQETERFEIAAALERNGQNRLRTAADLGISRMTLYKKLHKLGLIST